MLVRRALIDFSTALVGIERGPLPLFGILYFFYDADQSTWGYDHEDRGSWQVLFHSATDGLARMLPPVDLPNSGRFSELPLTLEGLLTYPDWQDERIRRLKLSEAEYDAYADLCASVTSDGPSHHLLGYASTVQGNDMDLECQLVTHGLYCGDETGWESPRRAEFEPGRADWLMLLQLDTDDRARMMWGDAGRLYFWIRKQDLERLDFSNVWMILQCS